MPRSELPSTQRSISALVVSWHRSEARAKREETIFEIASHFNHAKDLLTAPEERRELVELNLEAARRAKAGTAFASAAAYVAMAAAHLPDDAWERDVELACSVALLQAQCEHLTGQLEAAERRLESLALRPLDPALRPVVTCLRAEVYRASDRFDRAIAICVEQLRAMGMTSPDRANDEHVRGEYASLLQRVAGRDVAALTALPAMTDPRWLACVDVLAAILSSAVYTDKALHDLVVFRMANLSIEHGNGRVAPMAYARRGDGI